ncbi:hypothetical protein WJX72_011950 [[Myrmecia] bisecta]|uniref:Ion transport domain-containing protein n=1 Tax=[Myrmecia] bisecta TaxID=41462 RepID=A0AAW1R9P3_9CHLO
MIEPEGKFRTVWDVLAVIHIYCLIFYIPLLIAFISESTCNYFSVSPAHLLAVEGAYPSYGWQIFPIITNVFFVVDMFLNLFTGLGSDDGSVDYHLGAVWRHYFTSWFWIDIIACLPLECVLVAAAPSVNWYNTGKAIRTDALMGCRPPQELKRRSYSMTTLLGFKVGEA